jgi:hypothetical protein
MKCQSFKDEAGRLWEVRVNVASIKRVKSLIGLDMYALIKDGLAPFRELIADPEKLVNVLYCLCKPQADALGVTDEQFGELMAGDVLFAAIDAFVESYADFTPDQKARATLRTAFQKAKQVQDLLIERAARGVASLDPEEIVRSLTKSGESPESSESTLVPSPSPS